MQTNEKQLNDLLKAEQRNELSSEEEENLSVYEQPGSRSSFRKPIKNPFSDQSESQDSDLQQTAGERNVSPFPPKQPKTKSVLQQVQQTMKWNKQEQTEIQILSKLQGQGMKDKKIQQLAKKYKSLNIAYERQKTQRRNLQTQLNSQLKINEENNTSNSRTMEKENTIRTLDKSQVKEGKCNNCAQNEKKVMEFRLQAQNLKTQLNKAHRLITREIGEDFNIDHALNDQNAWKGRQQKIQKLKFRVRELEQKLANNGVNVSHMSGFTQMSTATKTNNNFSTTRTSTMAQNKRKQFDNLKIQVDALKSQNELLQSKVKSLASRKITLEAQIKELKAEYEKKKHILMEKSQNDDKFINLLKNENQKLKKQERVVTKIVYKDQKDNEEVSNLRKQIQRLKQQLKKSTYERKSLQKQQQQRQQKCLDSGQDEDKIQIKFPPQQKKRPSVQNMNRPPSSSKISQPSPYNHQPYEQQDKKPEKEVSVEKKKQLQNQHIKGSKYLKKLTPEEQISIYQNWKSGRKLQ